MKPNLNSNDSSPTSNSSLCSSSSSSSSSSSLLLQKSTSKFMPLITLNRKQSNKYNDNNSETDNFEYNDEITDQNLDDDDEEEDENQQISPISKLNISLSAANNSSFNLNTNSPNYERKRTANLENLIGNLKVRKLNQTSSSSNKDKNYYSNNNGNKMTSLYVEIATGANNGGISTSLSDISPSTPPLSSPSVSPSSLSIASDSPNHASSYSSSSSNNPNNNSNNKNRNNTNDNKSRYSMVPKFRWIVDSGNTDTNFTMNSNPHENKSNIFDPTKLNEIINETSAIHGSAPATWTNETANISTSSQKLSTTKQKPVKQANKKETNLNKPLTGQLSTGHKNQEDPTRQIKFYDDFIDFRGDVLRRPPDSKNCRILWEYLYLLLQNTNYSSVIRWEDESQMVFRIVQAEKLAALWGLQKNRLGMTYEKLSRGMRYYYPNNIIAREPGRRLLYRFMRHPDEIKKFVKKNGTYMLKRAKMNAKNSNEALDASISVCGVGGGGGLDESMRTSITDINPDDSGVDEPTNKKTSSIKNKSENNNTNKNTNHSKKAMSNSKTSQPGNDNEECPDDDEEIYDEIDDDENRDDSTLDEEAMDHNSNYKIDSASISSSPFSGISHNSSNNKQNTDDNNNNNSHQAAAALIAAAMTGANRLYPDLYTAHDLLQYYAAAAGLQQQSPSMASTYFSRLLKTAPSSSTQSKDDVNAAQFLMQLRNQNENQLLNETIKNFTNNINNNINNNNNNVNNQKSKRSSIARSNDLSSASSTSSNSSLEHSIDYENNTDLNRNNLLIKQNKSTKTKNDEMRANYLSNEELKANNTNINFEYPLNLTVGNINSNNNIKKRKSKYDI